MAGMNDVRTCMQLSDESKSCSEWRSAAAKSILRSRSISRGRRCRGSPL